MKRWDVLRGEKEASLQEMKSSQAQTNSEQTPDGQGQHGLSRAGGPPTQTAQSSERAQKLEKIRRNIRSIDSIYKAYNIKIECANGSHKGYLQPFKGANIQETSHFKCDNCTLQGEHLTSNSLGFFRCSEAGCMHCICLLCALSSEGGPISPQLFKLPLCKDLIAPQNKNIGNNNFICSSIHQKWKQDIPVEWSICESQLEEHAEKEFVRDLQGYEAINS